MTLIFVLQHLFYCPCLPLGHLLAPTLYFDGHLHLDALDLGTPFAASITFSPPLLKWQDREPISWGFGPPNTLSIILLGDCYLRVWAPRSPWGGLLLGSGGGGMYPTSCCGGEGYLIDWPKEAKLCSLELEVDKKRSYKFKNYLRRNLPFLASILRRAVVPSFFCFCNLEQSHFILTLVLQGEIGFPLPFGFCG